MPWPKGKRSGLGLEIARAAVVVGFDPEPRTMTVAHANYSCHYPSSAGGRVCSALWSLRKAKLAFKMPMRIFTYHPSDGVVIISNRPIRERAARSRTPRYHESQTVLKWLKSPTPPSKYAATKSVAHDCQEPIKKFVCRQAHSIYQIAHDYGVKIALKHRSDGRLQMTWKGFRNKAAPAAYDGEQFAVTRQDAYIVDNAEDNAA